MTGLTYLTWLPLASAAVWFALSAYLVSIQRYRTWTEVFLLGLCVSVGAYALSDSIFFSLSDESAARIAATASLTSVTFASFFIFLYGMSLYYRFRAALLLSLMPIAFFVATLYEDMFLGLGHISGADSPFVPVYNPAWMYPWLALLSALILAGVYGVLRTYLEIRERSPNIARRVGLTLLGMLIAIVAGAATNAFLAISRSPAPPLFSSTLVVPGVLVFFATTPGSFARLNAAILRRKASRYDIKGVFLTFDDGTLIGSKIVPEEEMIDAESFSATLDVIQNFMRTSFPLLKGKWLQSIRQGEYTLLMERGEFTYLTLVLDGEENDQLRRKAIEGLRTFEERNRQSLEHWRGMSKDAEGVDDLLAGMLASS